MAANPKSAKRERMSAVDTAWLRMDRPHNLMMISGVLLFRERITLSRLRRVIDERFLVFRRFRKIPVERTGGAVWEADPHFDLRHHVVATSLPGRAGRAELEAFVSGLAGAPLDPSHRVGNSISSTTSPAVARSWPASITAMPTGSRSSASCCR